MRRDVNKLATLVMTGMLAVSMSFGAFADESWPYESDDYDESYPDDYDESYPDDNYETEAPESVVAEGDTITIKKLLKTDGKTSAPNAVFGLTVSGGSAASQLKLGNQTYASVYAGISADNVEVTPAQMDSEQELASGTIYYEANFKVDFSKVPFEHAGIYAYQVVENNGEGDYPGVIYDTTTYNMYVFVSNNEDYTDLEITNVVFAKADGKKLNSIVNDYEKNVYDLYFTKEITGNAANLSETFTFKVKVDSGSGSQEFYKVYLVDSDGTETLNQTLEDGTEGSFIMGKDTKYHIYGITNDDVVTIVESEANANGYTSTYTITANGDNNVDSSDLTANGVSTSALQDGATVTITNDRDNITPTGVAMDVAPYALMVVLAGGAAFTFLRKKESFED